MDRAIVDRAIRALEAIGAARRTIAQPAPEQAVRPVPAPAEPPASEPKEAEWPSESLDAERRFGQPHAKLFPFIGRKVRTPAGPGTLLQVFAERVTVVLDSELRRCSFFQPTEIEPVSWGLP